MIISKISSVDDKLKANPNRNKRKRISAIKSTIAKRMIF
jgi:hypothetical protein